MTSRYRRERRCTAATLLLMETKESTVACKNNGNEENANDCDGDGDVAANERALWTAGSLYTFAVFSTGLTAC